MNLPTDKIKWFYEPAKWWNVRYRGGTWFTYLKFLKEEDFAEIRRALLNLDYPVKMETRSFRMDQWSDRFGTELGLRFRTDVDATHFRLAYLDVSE